jgi:hypothetical protein
MAAEEALAEVGKVNEQLFAALLCKPDSNWDG